MDTVEKVNSVKTYTPQAVERAEGKIWFSYVNKDRSVISAYYDKAERKLKSVVRGPQYGKDQVAIRNLVAQEVVNAMLK